MADQTDNGDQDDKDTTSTTEGENSTTETTTEDDPFKFEDDGTTPTTDEKKEDKTTPTTTSDDDVDADDKKIIQETASKIAKETVDAELKEVRAEREQNRVSTEWNKYVTDYPELKNFAPKILRYAAHESYKGKPITQAILDVAGVDIFVKIGAARAKTADAKSKETRESGGSTSSRPTEGDGDKGKTPSFVGMSKEDMYKEINAARQAGRK